ncbi:uncharacterized protein PV07_08696 [Cladophialophora immunda]|uniref:Uncharacterized protein n=1 Tax=Cladophialophora immunda TaxID=569365 RepID=A0A0D2C524_9EURO|nr:uncharacterized protein PV07_08696 [Cladophialophora immunda]KIW25530.1 hypothetical protein PV07_08696 [Cladophialophora immunda]
MAEDMMNSMANDEIFWNDGDYLVDGASLYQTGGTLAFADSPSLASFSSPSLTMLGKQKEGRYCHTSAQGNTATEAPKAKTKTEAPALAVTMLLLLS